MAKKNKYGGTVQDFPAFKAPKEHGLKFGKPVAVKPRMSVMRKLLK